MEERKDILGVEELWETHLMSELKLHDKSSLLPFRPAPIEGESFYSWIVRIIRENMSTIDLTFHPINDPRVLDTTWKKEFIDVFTEKMGNGEELLIEHHTTKWNVLFEENHLKARKLFGLKMKVCPLCLKDDNLPYMRLNLRLNIINSCSIHNCIVINQCPRCGSDFKPHKLRYDIPIFYCHSCQYDLRNASPTLIDDTNHTNAESSIRMILDSGTCPLLEHLNLQAPEFFAVVYQLSTFLIHAIEIDDPIFKKQLNDDLDRYKEQWSDSKSKFKFFKSPELTYLIINAVFYLLNDLERLSNYIKSHQAKYNRLTANTKNCPFFLKQFQNIRKKANNINIDYIKKIISKLQKTEREINNRTVAEEGGFDYSVFNYGANKHLNKLIKESRKNKYEMEIVDAIKKLKDKNEDITVKKVSKMIGMSPITIYNQSKLSKHFNIKQKLNPTYIPRIKNAIEEIKQQSKHLTVSGILLQAKLSRSIVYKYEELKKIIDNAIKDSKHPNYSKIKQKIEKLKESGMIITRELIERETKISIGVFYDHEDLRELMEEVVGNDLENHKTRLNTAFETLINHNEEVTIKSLSNEAGMCKKTLYRYKDLINIARYLVLNSKKRRLIEAKRMLMVRDEEMTVVSLLKEARMARSGWDDNWGLSKFLSNNKVLKEFIEKLISKK